jgi:hypothetical protein
MQSHNETYESVDNKKDPQTLKQWTPPEIYTLSLSLTEGKAPNASEQSSIGLGGS